MDRKTRIIIILGVILLIIVCILFVVFQSKEDKLPAIINQITSGLTKTQNYCTKDQEKLCGFDQICLNNFRCVVVLNNNQVSSVDGETQGSGDTSGGSGSSNEPTNPPTPPNPPNPDNPPVEPFMESESYSIGWDSVNGGGGLSASETYSSESTVGEAATGYSNSETYYAHAGYQQNDAYSISISVDPDAVHLGSIGGVTGGTATGSSVATVTTSNPAGYTLSAKAGTNPALRLDTSNSFANYTLPGTDPEYTWSVSSGAAEFGYSPKGTDIKAFFKDNGSSTCNSGSSQTAGKCWYPFSTSDVDIASSSSANDPTGTGTTFNVKIDSQKTLTAGTYTATITLTAITN